MSLLALKHRKKTIDMIYRASGAMKAAAVVRVRKVEKYIKDFQKAQEQIREQSDWMLETLFLEFAMNIKSDNKADILIGADKGMCGDFVNALQNYYKHKKTDQFWVIIGSKLESKCIGEKTFFLGNASLEQFDMIRLSQLLLNFIHEKQITELNIHYFEKDKIVQECIFSKARLEKALIKNQEDDLDVKVSVLRNLQMIYLGQALYQAMLSSSLEENKQRLVAMTQAKTNAEDMGKVIARLYHKARQEKITRELTEITSGVN